MSSLTRRTGSGPRALGLVAKAVNPDANRYADSFELTFDDVAGTTCK